MTDIQLDETSCGPLCQHPQCWASNRRVERGLPRLEVVSPVKEERASFEYGGLPTLKVQNFLDDYGFSSTDEYPSVYQVATLGTTEVVSQHTRQRSASAPSVTVSKSSKISRARGSQSRRERTPSRPPLLEPIQQSYPPKLSKVLLNQICGPITPSDEVRLGSPIYLWQPSEKSLRSIETPMAKTESKPAVIPPKDITEDLIPTAVADQEHSRKKMKSKRSKQTPTGGRPYTHPMKTPPPMTRRTLPADMDDGIAQLLSLPRDIILQILEHTKESDLFDKEKVQALLTRVMPHIQFDSNQRLTPELASQSPPLHAMGLLRNQKMPILEGKQKFEKSDAPLKTLPRMPLVLDRSKVTRSYKGGGDEGKLQHGHPRNLGGMPDVSHLLKNKMTSVSAKSLPPLLPGSKVTKPFHYTIQSLDLALTPHLTPENPPSSPRSEDVSTLYATLASESSEDHSLLSTAKHPHLAVMRQDAPASSHYSHGSPNQAPSYSTYNRPYASRPYGSPGSFNTPHGTPVSYSTPGPIPTQDTREGQASRISSGSTVGRRTLQTIHECPAATPDTTLAAASPSIKQPRSVSPWEAQGRHSSRALSTPTNPSPEVWPVVDEKSYLHSPENAEPEKPEKDIPETVAPPPSPAPSVRSGLLEEDTRSAEGSIIQKVMECNQSTGSDVILEDDGELTDGGRQKRALSAIEEDTADKTLKGENTDVARSLGGGNNPDTWQGKGTSHEEKGDIEGGGVSLVQSEAGNSEAYTPEKKEPFREDECNIAAVNDTEQTTTTVENKWGGGTSTHNDQREGLACIYEKECSENRTVGEVNVAETENRIHGEVDAQARHLSDSQSEPMEQERLIKGGEGAKSDNVQGCVSCQEENLQLSERGSNIGANPDHSSTKEPTEAKDIKHIEADPEIEILPEDKSVDKQDKTDIRPTVAEDLNEVHPNAECNNNDRREP